MDCDQVFMILTRGPFPTGESWDEQVENHLERCADCWRLAEALRPALEVFQEAVPPSEGRDLPGYWGDARPSSSAVAELQRSSTAHGAGDRRAASYAADRYGNKPSIGERDFGRHISACSDCHDNGRGRIRDCGVFPRLTAICLSAFFELRFDSRLSALSV